MPARTWPPGLLPNTIYLPARGTRGGLGEWTFSNYYAATRTRFKFCRNTQLDRHSERFYVRNLLSPQLLDQGRIRRLHGLYLRPLKGLRHHLENLRQSSYVKEPSKMLAGF